MTHGLRSSWLLLGLALAGLLGGAALWLAGAPGAADALWLGATAVAFVPLLVRVTRALLRREAGVDLIAVLALAGAMLLGEYLAGAVIGLMLASGRLLERRASARAMRELTALLARAPRVAHRVEGEAVVTVDVDAVGPGDLLLVKEADVLPVDGLLADEHATLDASALTGEARPVERASGDRLDSGTVNVGRAFRMRATASAAESTYAGVVRLVASAQHDKAPVARLADRYAALFIPFTLAVAAAAWALSGDPVRALAVLVVATPCPLLLAVPIAIVAGVSRAARRGVIVKGGGALELLARADRVFLDKTGTLTSGAASLSRVATTGGWTDEARLLALAGSVEQVSSHVLAGAIARAARARGLALSFPAEVREEPGAGVEGTVDGRRVRVGRYDWVTRDAEADDAEAGFRRRATRTLGSAVFVAVDGALAGALLLEDPIRLETPRTLRALRRAGVRQIDVLTGDHPAVAASVGAALGLDRVHAQLSPEEKVRTVAEARSAGSKVMVGDGINDAPALAAADVGVAMGARGATASSEAADVVLTTDRFDRLVDAILMAQRSRSVALQSVALGMGLSVVAMGAAAFGLLAPVVGAFLQEGIDLLAIGWALRALGPGAAERARDRKRRVLSPEAAAHLAADHEHLVPTLERFRNLADQLDALPRRQVCEELRSLNRFLKTDLLAHERADEAEVYPALAARLEGDDPLGTMSRTHQEIFHLARLLDLLLHELPAEGPEPEDLPDLRRLLYGLHAVLRLHFAQEEELYQSVTDDGGGRRRPRRARGPSPLGPPVTSR